MQKVPSKLIEYKGKTKSVTQWAKELGMKRNTLLMRVFLYGWSVEKAFTTPVELVSRKNHRKVYTKTGGRYIIEYNGEKKSIHAWAKKLGIAVSTLRVRIVVCGWSVNDAFTKPVKRLKNRDD